MKILVIGMGDSVHLSRWLDQFRSEPHEFRVLSSSPHRRLHPTMRALLATQKFSMPLISRYLSLPIWLLDRVLSKAILGLLIVVEVLRTKPDLIHVNEFQNAGYALLRARRFSRAVRRVKLLLTPYGSDIYWFRQFPNHLKKISELLQVADAMSCECHRDELLARELGFTGTFMPRVPAFGALAFSQPDPDRSARNTIAVKGYQYELGRALNALRAIELAHENLRDFKIVVFSSNQVTIRAARELESKTGLSVTAYPKFALTNEQVQAILSKSVAYVGLSRSDGISASMIEAMANGAIPIQSDSSCGSEWLDDGVGGFLVHFDDVNLVAKRLVEITCDVDWQRRAAQHNYESLVEKLNPSGMRRAALKAYRDL